MYNIIKEYMIITFFIYLLFPTMHSLFASIILQIRFIFDKQLKDRSDELGVEISFYFIVAILSNLFWFSLLFYVVVFLFYRSIEDFLIHSRVYYQFFVSAIFVFDLIYFTKIDQKYIKRFKSYALYVVMLTTIEFSDKKNKIIYSPMDSVFYWLILIIWIAGIVLKYR